MVEITSIRGATVNAVDRALSQAFRRSGFAYSSRIRTSTSLDYKLRVVPEQRGYRISPYTGHRGRSLGWNDWIEANNITNYVLDKLGVSANVKSLKGKFVIRRGTQAVTSWDERAGENVGSMMQPVSRAEAWREE